jgi:periplasmic protein TonB
MPQEFLRDVLRTGDAAERRQRHWSILPLSIAGHAVVLAVFLFSPWLTEADLPVIASPLPAEFIETVMPSPPPPPRPPTPVPAVDTSKAPIEAAIDIAPEQPKSSTQDVVEGAISNGPDVHTGTLLGPLGTSEAVAPPAPPLVSSPPKPLRPGGNIREPRKIVHVTPIYPDIARHAGVQGAVILEAILDATGRVESVRVIGSQPLLDDAAVRAVRQWRYTPTELNGVPVPVLMTITVRFSLER